MNEESPIIPSLAGAQKRSHTAIDGASSENEENPAPLPALVLTANQNASTEVTLLLNDPPAFRHAKILANLLHISNQLGAIVTAQPSFEVSPHLEKNIDNYAAAILLSSKISVQRPIPTNTLLHRFDLPVGIENNPADYAKVITAVQDAFTQLRSKFKKTVNKADKTIAPGPEHQNIFKVTQIFVDGTQCKVTIELSFCVPSGLGTQILGQARWPSRRHPFRGQGDAKKITRAFRYILTKDQDDHGVKDYEINDNGVDTFQQEVDDLIDAGTADLATSVAPAAQSGGDE
ncbi:hypothetical protein B0H14DRAFT_3477506 [Mycena olivaceomarginata]|nr:hypothetical protein B0H14DRAFT_3477506 [Mycena olivaceomarginata]